MAIYIDKEKLLFHLQGSNTSYVMQVIRGGYLSHLYWGKKIRNYRGSNKIIFMDRGFSPNPDGEDRAFSLDTIPQEYPSFGNSDFRIPAYQLQLENGSTVTDFRYKEHRVFQGKPKLKGLPSTYVEDDGEVATLEIVLEDPLIDVKVVLSYSLYQKRDVITRSVRFENEGRQQLKLLRALSASVDFRDDEYELITLYGAHNNEKNIARRKILPGIQMVDSCRGASSPQQAPFMALVRKGTDEEQGEVYAFNLVYSGNFTAQTQVDSYRNTRVTMGINPFDFTWLLEPEESFQTPEVVMVYTENGLGGMSRIYHDLYRNRLCRGPFRDKERPILINNWEATYFNFDADKIEQLAKEAQSVGVELFVLDDGWFGKRDDDNTSLGDWVVDRRKLPDGLPDLANRIRNLGLEFGLWFEPEMVSIDSDLYRKHPDWCIHVPDRPHTLGRNQLMLDLSRKEVCEYIIKSVSDILSDVSITYVKWDMNRHMTDVGSAALPPERQRETAHRYILGLYHIMEELTSRFPHVLFESCSSGGGRFDAGMLYYMPQTWTSDNTDAICRLKIQWGTSLVYPPITMGAHVSTVPNHQVGRITPLETRGYVAMAGNLGYELDLTTLTVEEKEIVKKQIALYKEMRSLIQFGNFYRMINPFDENEAAWSFVSEDQTEMAASYFKVLSQPAAAIKTLKFKGLNSDYVYRNVETGELFGGDELMHVGITLARVKQDFLGMFWRFVKEDI
ncbi:Bifunctional alpha-galactosidase/sucrose kinase AgaSK [Paenibacillus polymyxa E681]|uniref:alpha-galactosidase n=1 Tax=Paenibacillus polymyxa TaxID=1406 RepID=UPI0001E314AB|nr:alpha-galactosidase [Paenibacillus polymyxa]ADM68551.1 alpha-galactosidase [Paenibacillus polymyxa E681]QNV55552.1 Bifunctional alpha-galactosidase/sucrose kinase AgaSK [Paenibacillus polymyxa E681]QNV60388.1 Bifunctional alpha-galactosidase/sucrose kinase AgaSK [Paenibacillus polymyxa E681]